MSLHQLRHVLIVLLCCFPTVSSEDSYIHNHNGRCMLCQDGVSGLKRPHHFVDRHGTTCAEKALFLATDVKHETTRCEMAIDRWREPCCGDDEPDLIPQQPAQPPVWNGPTGEYGVCEICSDGSYPDNPGMVINMLYLGPGSCRQYYNWGRAGLIEDHLCDPLQHFSYEPCGCGIDFPNSNPAEHSEDSYDWQPWYCILFSFFGVEC